MLEMLGIDTGSRKVSFKTSSVKAQGHRAKQSRQVVERLYKDPVA